MDRYRQRGSIRQRAFSLIDVMVAIVIIGVGITALMQLMIGGTTANQAAGEASVAVQLTRSGWEEIRPWSLATMVSFAARTDADRTTSLAGGYTRQIEIYHADMAHLDSGSVVAPVLTDAALRTCILVRHNGKQVYTQNWIWTP